MSEQTDSTIINDFNDARDYFAKLGVEIKATPSGFVIGKNPERFIIIKTVRELKASIDIINLIADFGAINIKDNNGKPA